MLLVQSRTRKLRVYVGTIQRIPLYSDSLYSDMTPILTAVDVTWALGLICVGFVNLIFNFCLKSHRWFMSCLVYITHLCGRWCPEMGICFGD
jgi:hypothetical protein